MNAYFSGEKLKNIKFIKSKNKTNKIICIALVACIFIYALFFTSNLYIKDTGKYVVTPIGEVKTLGSKNISISKWEYSKKQKLMEISIDIKDKEYSDKNKFAFSAVTKPESKLKINKIIEESDFIVLHIENIPKDFTEISFRIKFDAPEETEVIRFYSNINEIKLADNITAKTKVQYFIDSLTNANLELEKDILKFNEEIIELGNKIVSIKQNNEKLEENKKFQTEEEILATDTAIRNNNTKIDESNGKIEEFKQKIKSNEEKIQKNQIHIDELSGKTVASSEDPNEAQVISEEQNDTQEVPAEPPPAETKPEEKPKEEPPPEDNKQPPPEQSPPAETKPEEKPKEEPKPEDNKQVPPAA